MGPWESMSAVGGAARQAGQRPADAPIRAYQAGFWPGGAALLISSGPRSGQRPADAPIRARRARFWPGGAAFVISSGSRSGAASGRCADPCSPSEVLAGRRRLSYLQRPAKRGSVRPIRRSVLAERGSGREAPPFLSSSGRPAERGGFRPRRRPVLAERGSGREAPPFLSPAARQAGQRPADTSSRTRRARLLPGVAALLISRESTVRSPPCPR
jgi:hypothetical protein